MKEASKQLLATASTLTSLEEQHTKAEGGLSSLKLQDAKASRELSDAIRSKAKVKQDARDALRRVEEDKILLTTAATAMDALRDKNAAQSAEKLRIQGKSDGANTEVRVLEALVAEGAGEISKTREQLAISASTIESLKVDVQQWKDDSKVRGKEISERKRKAAATDVETKALREDIAKQGGKIQELEQAAVIAASTTDSLEVEVKRCRADQVSKMQTDAKNLEIEIARRDDEMAKKLQEIKVYQDTATHRAELIAKLKADLSSLELSSRRNLAEFLCLMSTGVVSYGLVRWLPMSDAIRRAGVAQSLVTPGDLLLVTRPWRVMPTWEELPASQSEEGGPGVVPSPVLVPDEVAREPLWVQVLWLFTVITQSGPEWASDEAVVLLSGITQLLWNEDTADIMPGPTQLLLSS